MRKAAARGRSPVRLEIEKLAAVRWVLLAVSGRT
jgi:hypothetical protein